MLEVKSLNKKSDFLKIRKFGKKNIHNFANLTVLSSEKNDFRLAFQINKQTGNAVHRNKIRRQLRHLLYEIFSKYEQDPSNKGLWVLIRVNKQIEKFDFSEYKSFLEKKLIY